MIVLVALALLALEAAAPIGLQLESKVTVPSLKAIISTSSQCSASGSVLFQPYSGNDFSVFRISPDGREIHRYTFSGDYEENGWPSVFQEEDNSLVLLTQHDSVSRLLFVDRDGRIRRRRRIEDLDVGTFAAFGNGLYLVTGNPRQPRGAWKPATFWVINAEGRVINQVLKDPTPKVIRSGSEREKQLNLLATTLLASGSDGFVYAFRSFDEPMVLKIDSSGKIERSFRLSRPKGGSTVSFLARKGRFVVSYLLLAGKEDRTIASVLLQEYDASTGDHLSTYTVHPGELGVNLACYDGARFTFTGADEKGNLTIAVGKP